MCTHFIANSSSICKILINSNYAYIFVFITTYCTHKSEVIYRHAHNISARLALQRPAINLIIFQL